MEEKFNNLKGTRDYLPEDQLIRDRIVKTLKECFELYGFLPVESPILCNYDLLASKYAGGSEILKEVYKLTDQGNRKLGLRYDLTVPFAKIVATNPNLSLPFRRYEIGRVYRNGPVKLGRAREFYQCDIDVCGVSGNEIEVELFDLMLTGYKMLDLDVELIWNNRKFLSGLIEEAGIESSLVAPTIVSVDKLEKVGYDEVAKELTSKGVSVKQVEKLFALFEKDFAELKEELKDSQNQKLLDGISEIENVLSLIKLYNIEDRTRFTPFLARGLDIYTGTVWEIKDKSGFISSSLGGGGRYDDIITKFIDNGNQYPAVGSSFGLEPIFEIIKAKQKVEVLSNRVYVYAFDKHPYVYETVKTLRKNGISTLIEPQNIKLKKALPWAEKNGYNHVLIIGENEINEKVVTYKNLKESSQTTLTLEEFIKIVK